MTLDEYILCYDKLQRKEMTEIFNQFDKSERLSFLELLSDTDREEFIDNIRNQAVDNFWYHEREAILNGTCTRDWTPEQIENIMAISEKTGKMRIKAGKAPAMDENGVVLIDKKRNKSYYGHHMIDVSTHPEYAGDWRNIQALTYDEHYDGAHPNHDTKTPTVGYYDVEGKTTIVIDVDAEDFTFDNTGYPPKKKCIFKSDLDMKALYSNYL